MPHGYFGEEVAMGTVWAVTDSGDICFVGDDAEPDLEAQTGVPGVDGMVFVAVSCGSLVGCWQRPVLVAD
jgi:hypothetical protein